MKLTKDKVCVFIENEAQLQQAKELLEKYSQTQGDEECMAFIYGGKKHHYLKYIDNEDDYWYLSIEVFKRELIQLSELETILKNESK